MSLGRCACCNRDYRTEKAKREAEAFKATHIKLRQEVALSKASIAAEDKRERHRQHSADFRAGQT